MELEREFIERKDFSQARRGYDPDEVDRHLRQISESVDELKRSGGSTVTSGIAAAAAEQVRIIVEAAERSASDIQERAEQEGRRSAAEADAAARERREKANAEAAAHVQRVQEAASAMLERATSIEAEIDSLLGNLRTSATSLVDGLRGGAGSLQADLDAMRSGLGQMQPPPPAPEAPPAVEPEIAEAPAEEAVVEPAFEAEAAPPEPEPAAATAEVEAARGSAAGSEGARLIALNMALNGTPRDETARYLSENFDLDDQDALLDEVYQRAGGA